MGDALARGSDGRYAPGERPKIGHERDGDPRRCHSAGAGPARTIRVRTGASVGADRPRDGCFAWALLGGTSRSTRTTMRSRRATLALGLTLACAARQPL